MSRKQIEVTTRIQPVWLVVLILAALFVNALFWLGIINEIHVAALSSVVVLGAIL